MTTIKEFKEWLDRFPYDTIIQFGFQQPSAMYESFGCVDFESPNLEDCDSGHGWEYFNNRDGINKLRLGESM
jgi:hypothetical protein